jgi:hypothetical protein
MKAKEYLKELSLMILGVLIALLIDNYREDVRDEKIIQSYLDIVVEDLNLDIANLGEQVKRDSVYASRLKLLSDVLSTNRDLPRLKYSLAAWTTPDRTPHRDLKAWDSLDYYTLNLYSNNEYSTRKIGFSTIVNSSLSHRIGGELLKDITVYYTTDSDNLDFLVDIDDKCHWLGIAFLNQYQGSFKEAILSGSFNATHLRNEASGRYNTTRTEMRAKQSMIAKAKQLLQTIGDYRRS